MFPFIPLAIVAVLQVAALGAFVLHDPVEESVAATDTFGSAGIWYPSNNYARLVNPTWGVEVTSLVNCDTIDTNAQGRFACGTDSTAAGAFATSSADVWASTDLKLQELSDVQDPSAWGQLLMWTGSVWATTSTSSLGIAGTADGNWSTTSADYWETQQTARTADNLTDNSIENLNDVLDGITETWGDLLYWNGSAWADLATSTLGVSWNDLRSIPAGFADGVDNTGSGGAGLATSTAIADTYVIYGTSPADVGAEAAFTYDDATDKLTVVNASTTNTSIATGIELFGGGQKTTANALCIQLTGSSALCDSGDDTGTDTADDLSNNSIEDLNDVTAMTENFGDLLYWNGTTWADIATTSLNMTIPLSSITNPVANTTISMGAQTLDWQFTTPAGGMIFNFLGAATGHSMEIKQSVGNPGADMHLLHIEASDADPTILHLAAGSATSRALKVNPLGDTVTNKGRFEILANGTLQWSNGDAVTTDVNLYRNATDTLRTNGSLIIDGNLTVSTTTATATVNRLSVGTSVNLLGAYGTTPNSLCIALTGSAALCDSGDDIGTDSADDLTNNSIEDLNDVGAMTENYGDLLGWSGSTWTDFATSSLGISWNDIRSIPAGFSDGVDNVGISTSTTPSIGGLATWTGLSTVGTVATGTLTENVTGLEFNATGNLVGSAAILGITTGYGIPLTASTTNWNSFYDTPSGRITAGDGLTWSVNTLNFDGGNTPAGDLGGTWASPSVTDDSHAHTSTSISGLDISADTNLAVTYPVVLTDDTLSLAFGTTTANNWSLLQNFTTASATNFSVITGLELFGGGVKTTANALCQQLTGSADLCDGSDASGTGGTGIATSTAIADTEVIYATGVGTVGSEAGFTYSSSLDKLTVVNASTTNVDISTGLNIFGGGLKTTANALCIQLTGAAALCDSGDDTGTDSADDLTNNSIENLNDVLDGITENLGDLFYWNGTAWADIATSSLNISTTNLVEGTNLFYTDVRVGNYILGSTTLQLNGDLRVAGGDITLGATSIFSGGDTASLNNIDAIDATTETTFETALDTFTNGLTVGTFFALVTGASPTVDAAGELAHDTTDDQLIMADSGGTARVFATDEWRVISTTIASTSIAFASGQTLPALSFKDGLEITQYRCYVVGGTSKIVNLTDGTNDTETITCGTTVTSDTDVATNDTFTADELGYIEMGATSGTVNYLHFEAWARITRE